MQVLKKKKRVGSGKTQPTARPESCTQSWHDDAKESGPVNNNAGAEHCIIGNNNTTRSQIFEIAYLCNLNRSAFTRKKMVLSNQHILRFTCVNVT